MTLSILALGARTSHAQAWRCQGDMCNDDLINDIEGYTSTHWPVSPTIAMPNLPYTCLTKRDSCTHCATKGAPGAPGDASVVSTTSSVSGSVPWSVTFSGPGTLRSFLIGSFTAAADVYGLLMASPDGSMWGGTEVNYLFNEACDPNFPNDPAHCAYVGSSGVVDLGGVAFSTLGGSFWSSSLTFSFTVPTADIVTSCSVGYGNRVNVNPGGTHVTVSYPVSWTPVHDVLAERVRNQFRDAAQACAADPNCMPPM